MVVLGIMNGTSIDGVDYVWVKITGGKILDIKCLKHIQKEFSGDLRDRLLRAARNELTTYDLGSLQYDLGREYAKHYQSFSKVPKAELIGLHGQTIFHKSRNASWQIGEPTFLAIATGRPVIFNFRAADIACNGEGAPLAPIFHRALLKNQKAVAFHNLGGISNITYCHGKTFLAFDTGPASTLMDAWLSLKTKGQRTYDADGALARRGLPHDASLKKMLGHPFFKQSPPKSCGREEFNLDFIKHFADKKFFSLSVEDQLATLTELSAASIDQAYQRFVSRQPEKIYFSGGGTQNGFLMERLKIYLSRSQVLTAEDLGWPSSAIEGGAFALLAYYRYKNVRIDLSSITGGGRKELLGQICQA